MVQRIRRQRWGKLTVFRLLTVPHSRLYFLSSKYNNSCIKGKDLVQHKLCLINRDDGFYKIYENAWGRGAVWLSVPFLSEGEHQDRAGAAQNNLLCRQIARLFTALRLHSVIIIWARGLGLSWRGKHALPITHKVFPALMEEVKF